MEKLETKQTKDQIADMLRAEIINGGLPDGMEITQMGLAEQLGVSRMPIREAFQILEQEGFLKRLPNRHIQVVGLKQSHIRRYVRLLSSIEYELFKELLDSEGEGKMAESFIKRIKDMQGSSERIYKFHTLISETLEDSQTIRMHHQFLGGLFLHALEYLADDMALQTALQQTDEMMDILENGHIPDRETIETHTNTVMGMMMEA